MDSGRGFFIYNMKQLKTCNKCKIPKPLNDFHKRKNRKYGVAYTCKECRKQITRTYYLKNKEKVLEAAKVYRENNEEYFKEYRKSYKKRRLEDDYLFKLNHSISSLIRISFSNKGVVKDTKIETILGCTVEEFKVHIESQFLNWMNWDNKGIYDGNFNSGWDIDHIIPLSEANNKEDLIKLNHWSNFQPLCSRINRYIKRNTLYPVTNLELNIIKCC